MHRVWGKRSRLRVTLAVLIQPTSNKSVSSDRRKIWKHAMAVGDYRVYSLLASFHQEQPEVPQEKAESVPDQPVEEAKLCSAATWED